MAKKATKSAKAAQTAEPSNTNDTMPDFYDIDLSGIDTSFPLLREDTYLSEFASFAKEPSKDGSTQYGHFVFKTSEPGRDPTGNPVQAGYTLHKRVNLTVGPERTQDQIVKELARIVKDGFGKAKVSDLRPGDRCLITVKNSKERTDAKTGKTYAPSSEPRGFKPVK